MTSLECSPHNASCQLPCTMPDKACNLASNPVSRCPMAPMPLRYHCLLHYLRPRRDMEVLQSCLMPQPFAGFGTADKTCKHKMQLKSSSSDHPTGCGCSLVTLPLQARTTSCPHLTCGFPGRPLFFAISMVKGQHGSRVLADNYCRLVQAQQISTKHAMEDISVAVPERAGAMLTFCLPRSLHCADNAPRTTNCLQERSQAEGICATAAPHDAQGNTVTG